MLRRTVSTVFKEIGQWCGDAKLVKEQTFNWKNHEVIGGQEQEMDWSAVSSSMDVNTAWSAWKSSFFSVVDQSVPSKCVHNVRPKNPWVTTMIERLIKDKCSAYRAFKRDKSSSSRAVFNQLRNRVTFCENQLGPITQLSTVSFVSLLLPILRRASGSTWNVSLARSSHRSFLT